MLLSHAIGRTIVIAGPTAIGKTAAALALARQNPGQFEIVSADSIQAYRRFDIGSAKPTMAERLELRFHLIDVAEPDQDFTLVDYQTLAYAAMTDIVGRGKTPILVGGTGLYVRSIISGLGVPLAGPDQALRSKMVELALSQGNTALHQQLAAIDPESAERIHENDLKRTIRALEVFKLSGRPLSSWHREDASRERNAPRAYFVLDRNRANLYAKIDERSETMFEQGIIEETASLRAEGYSAGLKPMTALGYLQANQVLDDQISMAEAAALTKAATRQYARRQLIWFRGEKGVRWIDVEVMSSDDVAEAILMAMNEQDV
jgi:tRNA dimethylallyltransferase